MRTAACLLLLAGCDGVFGLYPIRSDNKDAASEGDASVGSDARPDAAPCASTPFSGFQTYETGTQPTDIAVADIDGDGDLDLATANEAADTISILHGNGDGTFLMQVTVTTIDAPKRLAFAHLDNDSILDALVMSSTGFAWLRGEADGVFTPGSVFTAPGPLDFAVGRFDANSSTDIVYIDADEVAPMLNNGAGTFVRGTPVTVTGPVDVHLASLVSSDELADVVTASSVDNAVTVLMNTDGTFGAKGTFGVGSEPQRVAVGFIDANTTPDIAVSCATDVRTLLGGGDGAFTTGPTYPLAGGNAAIGIGDFDANGNGDIAVVNSSTRVMVLHNDGSSFSSLALIAGNTLGPLAVADFDSDGRADIVVADPTSNKVGVYLGCPP